MEKIRVTYKVEITSISDKSDVRNYITDNVIDALAFYKKMKKTGDWDARLILVTKITKELELL